MQHKEGCHKSLKFGWPFCSKRAPAGPRVGALHRVHGRAQQGTKLPLPAVMVLFILLFTGTALASVLELRFIDVGQGDATLIRNGSQTVLVDAGPSDEITRKLKALGVKSLDLLVITHYHTDHHGGADAIMKRFPVRAYLDNGRTPGGKKGAHILGLVKAQGIERLPSASRTIPLGDARLRILPPPSGQGAKNENNASVGVIVERGKFKALLTGDSEVEEINAWLKPGLIPDVDVLKAAHHGSRNGVTPLWLHWSKPEVVAISVGASNDYGHPEPWALRYYRAGGRRVYRTDLHGDVTVLVGKDGRYRVETGRQAGAEVRSEPGAEPVLSTTDKDGKCCRICRKGKPCGEGCIAKDKACKKPAGCACSEQRLRLGQTDYSP